MSLMIMPGTASGPILGLECLHVSRCDSRRGIQHAMRGRRVTHSAVHIAHDVSARARGVTSLPQGCKTAGDDPVTAQRVCSTQTTIFSITTG